MTIAVAPTAVVVAIISAWHFPYATDDPIRREDAQRAFYEIAYDATSAPPRRTASAKLASRAKFDFDIRGHVGRFVERYRLQDARVLDVGSGSGYLQDVVADYTGLDISSSAARFYHKPFIAGTATAMPFRDGEFDVAWSIWVLEHIPNPEAALREIRRVVRPDGYLYLQPAWDVKPWAAAGYEARPYGELNIWGKAVKASIPVRRTTGFETMAAVPARVVRAATSGRPSRLHYRRLTPNYEEYWQADSDAVSSLDPVEVALWFESRGDTCLNCRPGAWRYLRPTDGRIPGTPLIIRRGR